MTDIFFFGSPEFSKITLENILADSQYGNTYKIVAVFTKAGSPTHTFSQNNNLDVHTPTTKDELAANLAAISKSNEHLTINNQQLFLVSAYGFIFTREILNLPSLGCFNIHGSFLPKYRGASPIQTALINGDTETGVTIIKMDEGIDTGEILSQEKVTIKPEDNFQSLSQKMANAGAKIAIENLLNPLPHTGVLRPQSGTATYTKIIKKEDGMITATEILENPQRVLNKLRAFTPWPELYTSVHELKSSFLSYPAAPSLPSKPSKALGDKRVAILAAEFDKSGKISFPLLQIEGKKPISWKAFENGYLKS
jgi:methionyl-tRNA formyltransferase